MPQTFIDEIADHLLDQQDLRKVAVIMPNKRAATYLTNALGKKAQKAMWSPQMITLNEWIDQLTPERIISSTEGIILLYEAYKSILGAEAESFSDFFKWGNMLRNDFNEIEVYMLNHKDVYRNLKDIKDIEEWSFNANELSDNQKKYLKFWEQLGNIFEQYKTLLKEQGLQFFGGALRKLAENPLIAEQKIPDINHYVFAGFNALSKAEEVLIDYFVKENKANVFWDIDQYYLQQEEHEAAYFYRQFKDKWNKERVNAPGNLLSNSLREVEMIGVPQYTLQARLAASLLEKIPVEEHGKTAVVLGDEKLLEPFLSGIPERIREMNVTMGMSLKNTPLKALIDALFDVQTNYYKYKSFAKGIYYKDLFTLVRHPYMKGVFPEMSAQIEPMYREAVAKNYSFLKRSFLEKHKAEELLTLLAPWKQEKMFQNAYESIRFLIQKLKRWAINEEKKFEGELILKFEEGTTQFHRLLEDYQPDLNLSVYRSLFHHFWSNEKVDYLGDPLDQIQVMGLLETRMLDFKNIIFVAMNEDVIPKKSREQSMMPYDLKRYFQLPTRHERDAIFAHHFYRLLHRAEKVKLIYNTENDDFGSGEKSRYLTQLEHELPLFAPETTVHQSNFFTTIEPSAENKIEKTTAILNRIKSYFKSGVSPTALNTFYQCPLDFYYKYVLNLGEDEEVEESFTFSSFGTIIHDTLEELYSPYVGSLLSPAIIEKMIKLFPQVLKNQTLKKFDEEYINQGANHVYFEAAKAYVRRFLDEEQKWLGQHECKIIALEKELTKELEVEVGDQKVVLKIKGKADRIDEVDGSRVRIVDYKTGNVQPADLMLYKEGDPKPKALQLGVYSLMYNHQEKETVAGNISLQKPEDGFITIQVKEKSGSRSTVKHADIHGLVQSIIQDFCNTLLDKDKPFVHEPSASYCDYCH